METFGAFKLIVVGFIVLVHFHSSTAFASSHSNSF